MSITIYHKMWGMVSMKEKGMCRASVLFEKSAHLLVCSPVRKAVLSRFQTDLACPPQILKALCPNIFVPGTFRVSMEEIVDRHLFLVEILHLL